MSRRFQPLEAYAGRGTYQLLPFRFLVLRDGRELLTTDAGEWIIVPRGTVSRIASRAVRPSEALYKDLCAKQVIYDDAHSPLLDVLAAKVRTKKSFLDGFTKLHIFVVSLRCEHTCIYCQVSRQTEDRVQFDMSLETADRAIGLMLQSPARHLTLEFQGGEPFLAFDTVRHIVSEAKRRSASLNKSIEFVVATNLSVASDEQLRWCRDEGVLISTSLDGPAFVHNANRPRPGADSHARAVDGIVRAREIVGIDRVSALMTTSALSLKHPIEIIDEYVRLDFRSIFLRPISPYGFAVRGRRTQSSYGADAFLDFYRKGLAYILELNRAGTDLIEVYAKIILTKLLTPFPTRYVDLESPAGAAIDVAVYNYDGDVYASDEGRMLVEMGDRTFRLGNVHRDGYRQIFRNEVVAGLLAAGTAEGLPGCSQCALQPFCGGDPTFHHATQGDAVGHRPTSAFCRRNMDIIQLLIDLASSGNPDLERIFMAWVRDKGVRELAEQVSA